MGCFYKLMFSSHVGICISLHLYLYLWWIGSGLTINLGLPGRLKPIWHPPLCTMTCPPECHLHGKLCTVYTVQCKLFTLYYTMLPPLCTMTCPPAWKTVHRTHCSYCTHWTHYTTPVQHQLHARYYSATHHTVHIAKITTHIVQQDLDHLSGVHQTLCTVHAALYYYPICHFQCER